MPVSFEIASKDVQNGLIFINLNFPDVVSNGTVSIV